MKILNLPRKIIAHPHRVTGLYASQKNGAYIGWESQLEKDVCYLLEHDSSVLFFESQSRTFEYIDNGKKRTYTPDFYVKYIDGREVYYEVKPQKFVLKFKMEKKKILEEIISENIKFNIITEIDIRCGYFLENIKYLERFTNINIEQKTLDILNKFNNNYVSIKNLSEFVPLSQIYHLIYLDFFDVDLNAKLIDENSILGLIND